MLIVWWIMRSNAESLQVDQRERTERRRKLVVLIATDSESLCELPEQHKLESERGMAQIDQEDASPKYNQRSQLYGYHHIATSRGMNEPMSWQTEGE